METTSQSTTPTHLIAGASRGIGRSLVDQSIAAGHQVYALSRTPPESVPADCNWITGDITNPSSYIDQLPEQIDALTFCAGKVVLGPLKRLRPEQMLEAYKTSVLDAFTLIQAILPKLSGSVVLFSSVAARTGLPNHCAISAAKSGLEGFAIALAAELAPKVRVNVIAPTLTPTEMGLAMVGGEKMIPMIEGRHPLKKLPAVEEVAATALYLHSSGAVSMTGQILKIDGGMSRAKISQ